MNLLPKTMTWCKMLVWLNWCLIVRYNSALATAAEANIIKTISSATDSNPMYKLFGTVISRSKRLHVYNERTHAHTHAQPSEAHH